MRDLDDLVAEADAADVPGWGFDWLEGRATEQRPSWGFARLLSDRLALVDSALDLDTGGGEVLAEAKQLPAVMVATEGWPINAARARANLGPRGIRSRLTGTRFTGYSGPAAVQSLMTRCGVVAQTDRPPESS